jgi:hypothetical protein
MSDNTKIETIIRAALTITRSTSPYSELPWIADVRAAVSHLLTAAEVDAALLAGREEGWVILRTADLVQGCADKAAASELRDLTDRYHYAGLAG